MGILTPISTLPDKWCRLSASFVGTYEANKRYLGLENNLERTTSITLEWQFRNEAEQKEFFDWWAADVAHGGKTFYAKVPLFADNKLYLLVQSKPLIQKISPKYKISCQFMLYFGKTKDSSTAPVAHDVRAIVEENSRNNIISMNITDADGDKVHGIELVGNHDGATISGSTIVYTPVFGFTGVANMKYKAFDGTNWSNVANIQIQTVADGYPIAWDMLQNVAEGAKDFRYFLLDGEDEMGKPLTYTITDVGGALAANIVIIGGREYAKITGTAGMDGLTFKYKSNNGVQDSTEGTVTIKTNPHVAFDTSHLPFSVKLPMSYIAGSVDVNFQLHNPYYIFYSENGITVDPTNATIKMIDVTNGNIPAIPSVKMLSVYATSKLGGLLIDPYITVIPTNVVGVTNEVINYKLGVYDLVGARVTSPATVTMVSTSSNKHYEEAVDFGGSIHLPMGKTMKIGAYKTPPVSSPNAGEYGDVLNWADNTPIAEVGYGDIFTSYSLSNIDATVITVTVDEYGIMSLTKVKSDNTKFNVTLSNKAGDSKTIEISIHTYVVIP